MLLASMLLNKLYLSTELPVRFNARRYVEKPTTTTTMIMIFWLRLQPKWPSLSELNFTQIQPFFALIDTLAATELSIVSSLANFTAWGSFCKPSLPGWLAG